MLDCPLNTNANINFKVNRIILTANIQKIYFRKIYICLFRIGSKTTTKQNKIW